MFPGARGRREHLPGARHSDRRTHRCQVRLRQTGDSVRWLLRRRAQEGKRRRVVPPPSPARSRGGAGGWGESQGQADGAWAPPPPGLLWARSRGLFLPSRAPRRPRPASRGLQQPGPGQHTDARWHSRREVSTRASERGPEEQRWALPRLAGFQTSRPPPRHTESPPGLSQRPRRNCTSRPFSTRPSPPSPNPARF